MSHLLAVDPGSTTSGWALVRRESARVRYQTSGTCESTPRAFEALLRDVRDLLGIDGAHLTMALEVVEGAVFQPFRAPTLLTTAEAVGAITAVAWREGVPVVRLTAAGVRKALVGKATAGRAKRGTMDGLIEDAVRANVVGLPTQTNVHVRDAMALAIVSNWNLMAKRVA